MFPQLDEAPLQAPLAAHINKSCISAHRQAHRPQAHDAEVAPAPGAPVGHARGRRGPRRSLAAPAQSPQNTHHTKTFTTPKAYDRGVSYVLQRRRGRPGTRGHTLHTRGGEAALTAPLRVPSQLGPAKIQVAQPMSPL